MTAKGLFELLMFVSGMIYLVGMLHVGCSDAATNREAWVVRFIGLVFLVSIGVVTYYN